MKDFIFYNNGRGPIQRAMAYMLLAMLGIHFFSCKEQTPKRPSDHTTDYFEFHNSFWINLHHFLYQKADGGQLGKLREDGFEFPDIGEENTLNQLSFQEREILDDAILYYRDSLVTKDLRRDLNGLSIWFQGHEGVARIKDTTYGQKFTETINRFAPVYQKRLWKMHGSHNLHVLAKNFETIDAIEEEVLLKMEKLSMNKWPDSIKVRVDITAYGNWAGAYTTSRPHMNIILSTMDPLMGTTYFQETVLHEGSHLLYLFGKSPIRDMFYNQSEDMGIEFPRNLWHASMFYLCGRATQDALIKRNVQHPMNMEVKHIFSGYNSMVFKAINESYYRGEINADTMVERLLEQLRD